MRFNLSHWMGKLWQLFHSTVYKCVPLVEEKLRDHTSSTCVFEFQTTEVAATRTKPAYTGFNPEKLLSCTNYYLLL